MIHKTFFIILCVSSATWARGQTAVLTLIGSSGDASPTFSYSLGEVVTGGQADSTQQHLTAGFQQSEIWLTGIHDAARTPVDAVLYPNPADNAIWIEVKNASRKTFTATITDAAGKVHFSSNAFKEKEQFDVSSLSPGSYTVALYSKNELQKTFQIIKNN